MTLPRIGLLSDSHGRADTTQRAVDTLLEHGAEYLLHMGDIGSVLVIDALVATLPGTTQRVPAHLVFGNVDWDADDLQRYATTLGVTVDHPMGTLHLGGKTIIYLHGDRFDDMHKALQRKPDYVFHGHTHQTRDERLGKTRVINPGALFRARRYTVALLDTDTDTLTLLPVDDSPL